MSLRKSWLSQRNKQNAMMGCRGSGDSEWLHSNISWSFSLLCPPLSLYRLVFSLICATNSPLYLVSDLHTSMSFLLRLTLCLRVYVSTAVLLHWTCGYFCIVEAARDKSQLEKNTKQKHGLSNLILIFQLPSGNISEVITCYVLFFFSCKWTQ